MITEEQKEELLGFLLEPKRHERNILKLCEELSELGEILLKYVNKNAANKPPISKIVEELGDVFFRANVLAEQFDITDDILERMDKKGEQVYQYYLEKTKEEAA
jgi:NTP pyrophosphatase (non-canonical NTP hydrolase)